MFTFAHLADFMVNPVNLKGAMGAGLALEFKTRFPKMFEAYRDACLNGKFKLGSIMTWSAPDVRYKILNLATKNHWVDDGNPELIKQGLGVLQRLLERKENRYAHVVMPMLGCGLGNQDYETMLPFFYEYLDGLDAVISLSMHPDKLGYIPKYLGIVGPRCWADEGLIGKTPKGSSEVYTEEQYKKEYTYVEEALHEACALWGVTPSDFDAFISGGAHGVDTVACGRSRTDPTYERSLAKKYSKPLPVICHADWERYGNSAGMIRNQLVKDIATHMIVIRPKEVSSIGTTAMARSIMSHNAKAEKGEAHHIHCLVKGDSDLTPVKTAIDIHR